ncbi:MAG TPA: MEDS domain-containing protein [Anaerolineae bacterium]|nr:MEDS domain-containing protein [Anaerolineae bacterium]HOR01151.1 MEDS domain-containing protein [Anaerolineae bacterium]HPL27937.1 MEDS domain-containing protein [Anaerolineae bacterium]
MTPQRTLADLKPGSHVAWLYETDQEHQAIVTAYLRLGLERGEKVLYAAANRPLEALPAYLRAAGLDVAPYLASGQMAIVSAAGPLIDITALRNATLQAQAEGYTALRATREMAGLLPPLPVGRLTENARAAEEVLAGSPCLVLCQFDRRRCDAAAMLQAVAMHPWVIAGTTLYDNAHRVAPQTFVEHGLAGALLNQWLQNLAAHREAQGRLRHAIAELDGIFRAGAGALFRLDPAGTILGYRAGPSEDLLLQADTFLGRRAHDLLPPDVSRDLAAAMARAQQSDRVATFECTLSIAGEEQPLEVRVLALPGQDVLVLARDIASRRAAQKALRHHLAMEAAVTQASALLAAGRCVDLSEVLAVLGQAVGASRAYIFMFKDDGRRADNTHEWCAPGVAPQMQNLQDMDNAAFPWWMGKLWRGEDVVIADLERLPPEAAAERQLLAPQGIRALLSVPLTVAGRLSGFLGFDDTAAPHDWAAEDVRLLRAAAEALAAYEERQRATESLSFLAEASRVLATSLDYEATLQSVAQLCVPILGDWCIVEVAGDGGVLCQVAAAHADPAKQPLLDELTRAYPPSPHGLHPASRVLRTGQWEIIPELHDETWATPVAERHRALVRTLGLRSGMVVPLIARGRSLGTISFASGRTRCYGAAELALAEELARRCALAVDNARLYREAQQAIRSRDEFLSVAAHELKTPLTGLRGFAQLSLRRLHTNGVLPPQDLQRALQVIDEQSAKLSQLIGQLLDVSRIEAGQLRLERRPVDLVPLVAGVVDLARAESNAHPLVVRAPSSLPAVVDPLRLEQVLANLIDNAIKFSPDGRPIDVDLWEAGGTISLAVRDYGPGIAPEHRRRIFERFYQVQAASPGQGLGLGLYVSQRIVALHEGHCEVESPAGGGTRFVVVLPASADSSAR